MDTISRNVARSIIEAVGGPGEPPAYGFQFFTAALDEYLVPLENEYLSSFIKEGGGSFKMVVGTYGIGKTHFLYNVREIAWKHGYSVSYVTLHPTYTPFYKLEAVYQAIVTNLTTVHLPCSLVNYLSLRALFPCITNQMHCNMLEEHC